MGELGVRIVAGRWKGRRLVAPPGRETRPTSDRVREAVFSSLVSLMGEDLAGARVVDLFAGTGALSLEALSRGASAAVMVENGAAALKALRANVEALGASGQVEIVAADATGAGLERAAKLGPFALLLADAPYRIEPVVVAGAIARLEVAGALAPGCVFVVEHAAAETFEAPEGHETIRTYVYGDTAVTLAE